MNDYIMEIVNEYAEILDLVVLTRGDARLRYVVCLVIGYFGGSLIASIVQWVLSRRG